MKYVAIARKKDISYSNMEMYHMAREAGKPQIFVVIDGFWYFQGSDGYMWQHDASAPYPDGSTQNTDVWTTDLYGEELDESDIGTEYAQERQNVLNNNIVALAALNMVLGN